MRVNWLMSTWKVSDTRLRTRANICSRWLATSRMRSKMYSHICNRLRRSAPFLWITSCPPIAVHHCRCHQAHAVKIHTAQWHPSRLDYFLALRLFDGKSEARQGGQWFDLDWILSLFVLLDDQIARISRMKASIFFVIRARSGPRFCSRLIPQKNVMIRSARDSLSSVPPRAAARLSIRSGWAFVIFAIIIWRALVGRSANSRMEFTEKHPFCPQLP